MLTGSEILQSFAVAKQTVLSLRNDTRDPSTQYMFMQEGDSLGVAAEFR